MRESVARMDVHEGTEADRITGRDIADAFDVPRAHVLADPTPEDVAHDAAHAARRAAEAEAAEDDRD